MPPNAAASFAVLASAPPLGALLLGGAGAPHPASATSVATARLAAATTGFLRKGTSGVRVGSREPATDIRQDGR